jgi:ubiquinone/menaquinone biosynthesis C-methylase UbiE
VQETIVLVAGLLYRPLVGKLTRYPAVSLDIEPGNGKVFLDIGSSWGRWTLAAAKLGYRAIGVDPNLDAVKAARRVAAQQNLQADFVIGDARALPVRDLCVDVAFSYSVLQHFAKSDVRAALEEVRRKMSPSGFSLIQMANRAGARSLYHQARRRFREADGFDVRYWSIDDLQETFSELIGPSEIFADCYFGLGIQPRDADMLPVQYRMAVRASETLRRLSQRLRLLARVADSVFVRSRKGERSASA